jgi:hypothetical protein
MERINVFKVRTKLAIFFLITGIIFTILAISLVIYSVIQGFNTNLLGGDWIWVLFTIEGVLFFLIGYSNIKNKKYYIEWDEKEIRCFLPGTKIPDIIKFDQIESSTISLYQIELKLANEIKILNLETFQFEDIKRIKQMFENMPLKSEVTSSL